MSFYISHTDLYNPEEGKEYIIPEERHVDIQDH